MKNLKWIILVSISITVSTVSADSSCSKCGQIKKLEAELNGLNYFRRTDFIKGAGDSVETLDLLESFQARKTDIVEFEALVHLVAASLPYDVETAAAGDLSRLISDSPALKATYDKTMPSIHDNCRRQFLQNVVEEYACQADVKRKKGSDADSLACVKKFNFDFSACLKSQAGGQKPADKSPNPKPKSTAGPHDGAGLSPCLLDQCPSGSVQQRLAIPNSATVSSASDLDSEMN